MDNLIKQYFTAWETKDLALLKKSLSPNFKGVRTIFEEKIYDQDFLSYAINNPRKLKYQILSIEQFNTFSYVDAYLKVNNDKEELVTVKFSFDKELITTVYETEKLLNKRRIKCIVSYDGSMFNGYQKQPSKNTVQDEIELAIYKATKSKCIIHSSGRTDSGVHAYNQVFHFDIDSKIPDIKFKDVINSYLPDGIYIKESIEVHETFHSRYDILYKEYVYKINKKEYDVIMRNYEWYPGTVDFSLFKKELKSIIGTHDFTSLTKTNEKSNIRTIFDISFVENDHYIYTYIKGNGFLRYMVRNIIASAILIAQNKTSMDLLDIIGKKDNNILKDIAPSSGLYMNKVKHYD